MLEVALLIYHVLHNKKKKENLNWGLYSKVDQIMIYDS